MISIPSRALAIIAIVVACLSSAVQAADTATLAGHSFEITTTGPDTKTEQDTLVFTATDADSIACHPYGFGKGTVTYSAAKDGTAFTFTTTSAKEGSMTWKGVATTTTISGTMTWTKDGKDTAYVFSEKKAEPKK